MFNFKTLNFIFGHIIIAIFASDLFFSIGFIPYISASIIYFIFIVIGVMNIRLGFFIKALCRAGSGEKAVSLTFDDGPAEFTSQILDILKEYNIKATFFCIGKQIEENPEMLKRINNEGHLIANHSYSHNFWFDFWSSRKIIADLKKAEELVYNLTSHKIKLFRPPYGVTNPAIKKAAVKMKYTVIGWSLRSFDTVHKDREKLLYRLKRLLKPGKIILLHDSQKITAGILKDFLDYTIANNIPFKRLDELLKIEAYEK